MGQLWGIAKQLLRDDMVWIDLDPELIIVPKITKDTPTDLYLQHFDTLLLEGKESRKLNVILLFALQLLNDYVFDLFDILEVKLALKDPFLQSVHFGIIEFAVQI